MRRRRPLVAGGVVALVCGSILCTVGLVRGLDEDPGIAPGDDTTAAADLWSGPTADSATGLPATSAIPQAAPSVTSTTPAEATHASVARPSNTPDAPSHPRSDPTVEVRAIGLDLVVQPGGVGASGSVVPPAGRAIWVRGYGRVAPGGEGTAVVAGHVVSYGRADVFAKLTSVRVGNEVRVTSSGVMRTFVVKRTAVVTKAGLTRDADVWGANPSVRRIVLITCDDDLGYRSDGHRVANYVVVADAMDERAAGGGEGRTAQ